VLAPVVEPAAISPYSVREVVGGSVGGGAEPSNSWEYQPQESLGKVSSSWYDPAFLQTVGPPPTNGMAVASLVCGIVANLFDLLLIPMILAFVFGRKGRAAASTYAITHRNPVGRTMAAWGTGLAFLRLAWYAFSIIWLALYFTNGWGYNERQIEANLTEMVAQEGLVDATVDCPASGSLAPGSVIDCSILAPNGVTAVLRGTVPAEFNSATLNGTGTIWQVVQS
jgi:hypothetical protein